MVRQLNILPVSQLCQAGWAVRALGNPEDVPVVLLHGFMQDFRTWESIEEGLACSYYLSEPSMTAGNKTQATFDALVKGVRACVERVLRQTGRERLVLLGYSMGGRLAIEYAHRYPETLAGLVLESAGLGPEDEAQRMELSRRNRKLSLTFNDAATMEDVVDYWESLPLFQSQQELPEEARQSIRAMRLRAGKDQVSWMVFEAGAQKMRLAAHTRDLLQQANYPVLYLAGEHDAKYRAVAESLQGGHVEVQLLPCGHDVHRELPSEYVEAVSAFLDRITQESKGFE